MLRENPGKVEYFVERKNILQNLLRSSTVLKMWISGNMWTGISGTFFLSEKQAEFPENHHSLFPGYEFQQTVENYVESQVFNTFHIEKLSAFALVLDVLDDIVYKVLQVLILLDSSGNAVH